MVHMYYNLIKVYLFTYMLYLCVHIPHREFYMTERTWLIENLNNNYLHKYPCSSETLADDKPKSWIIQSKNMSVFPPVALVYIANCVKLYSLQNSFKRKITLTRKSNFKSKHNLLSWFIRISACQTHLNFWVAVLHFFW